MSTAKAFDWQPPMTAAPVRHEPPIEMESIDCLLCGGADHETAIVASGPRTSRTGKFRIVRCRDCGLHFTNPRPTRGSIGLFYAEDRCEGPRRPSGGWRRRLRDHLERVVLQDRFGYPPHAPASPWERLQARLGRTWLRHGRERLDWIPFRAPGRLLDFGCGDGRFLARMRELGWNVAGLELSSTVAEFVRESTGAPVHVGMLPHPAVPHGSLDAVTMWHSLERLHQPREVLRHVRAALRPGGVVAIGAINFSSWSYRQFRHEWDPLALPRQLVQFTPETLRDLLRREGFGVLSLRHIARPSLIRRSARRAAQAGWGPAWLRLLRNGSAANAVARWTERTKQADLIHVVAERI